MGENGFITFPIAFIDSFFIFTIGHWFRYRAKLVRIRMQWQIVRMSDMHNKHTTAHRNMSIEQSVRVIVIEVAINSFLCYKHALYNHAWAEFVHILSTS